MTRLHLLPLCDACFILIVPHFMHQCPQRHRRSVQTPQKLVELSFVERRQHNVEKSAFLAGLFPRCCREILFFFLRPFDRSLARYVGSDRKLKREAGLLTLQTVEHILNRLFASEHDCQIRCQNQRQTVVLLDCKSIPAYCSAKLQRTTQQEESSCTARARSLQPVMLFVLVCV